MTHGNGTHGNARVNGSKSATSTPQFSFSHVKGARDLRHQPREGCAGLCEGPFGFARPYLA